MSSFRKPHTVKRKSSGDYVKGRWQGGTVSELTVMASAQPLKASELAALPEGQRGTGLVIKIYTDTELKTALEETETLPGQSPDIFIWQGKNFEVIEVAPYQSGVIPHYKCTAVEVRP